VVERDRSETLPHDFGTPVVVTGRKLASGLGQLGVLAVSVDQPEGARRFDLPRIRMLRRDCRPDPLDRHPSNLTLQVAGHLDEVFLSRF
jgi:hypothetical protein